MKFSIKDFFSKRDQMRRKLWKSLTEDFIFCAVVELFSGLNQQMFTKVRKVLDYCKNLFMSYYFFNQAKFRLRVPGTEFSDQFNSSRQFKSIQWIWYLGFHKRKLRCSNSKRF